MKKIKYCILSEMVTLQPPCRKNSLKWIYIPGGHTAVAAVLHGSKNPLRGDGSGSLTFPRSLFFFFSAEPFFSASSCVTITVSMTTSGSRETSWNTRAHRAYQSHAPIGRINHMRFRPVGLRNELRICDTFCVFVTNSNVRRGLVFLC